METYRIKVGKLSRNNNLNVLRDFCVNTTNSNCDVLDYYRRNYSGFDVDISTIQTIDLSIKKDTDSLEKEISILKDRLENGNKVKVLKSSIYRNYMPKEYIDKYNDATKAKQILDVLVEDLNKMGRDIIKKKHHPFASSVEIKDDLSQSYIDYEIELNGCIIEKTVD